MECPNCQEELKIHYITIEGLHEQLKTYQCTRCSHCDLDEHSTNVILKELARE
ncbi:MAG: hypothetical protein Q7R96_03140 [Nanoarchaeota archaeon]|nr:hypothetical protein [Nanoarchaeota archaeon]